MDVAKIFENRRSQAVRLQKQYRFKDSEVFIKKLATLWSLAVDGQPATQAGAKETAIVTETVKLDARQRRRLDVQTGDYVLHLLGAQHPAQGSICAS